MCNGQTELAELCLNAKDGGRAKSLSKSILCEPDWDKSDRAYTMMKDIVRSKISQVPKAKESLHNAWKSGATIVESVPNPRDKWWGSSLDHEATAHTKPDFWPGENKLGQILTELATEFFGEPPKWSDGVPGVVQGLEDTVENSYAELNDTLNSEPPEENLENSEYMENSENPSQDTYDAQEEEKSVNVNVNPKKDTSKSVESVKVDSNEKDIGKKPDCFHAGMVPTEEQLEVFLKKANYASKLREKANASKSRSRSCSPSIKKQSSPRTPSKKRNQVSPSESHKTKVAISENVDSCNSSTKSGKARFLDGSTKVS